MKNAVIVLRSLAFYLCYASFSTVFCLTAVFFIWFLPFEWKFTYLSYWNQSIIFFSRVIAGIDYRVAGLENIPKGKPYVVLAKHQSQWETFYFLLLFMPVSIILKRELLNIPGFGWGLRLLKPIPIDRSNPKQALKQILSEGKKRINDDRLPLLIFPEGTRIPVDKAGKYARSGASIAIETGAPLLLVSHNAGFFWPADRFRKYPGTVDVIISEPIDPTGKTANELTAMAQEWIESHIREPEFR